ncbi:MAG TPA: L-threonylcarbamoyladenylate synthase [Spirochaetota bacterium]|nr:L-threonylcarbamoyladenylate synthase [Spirochaetota bacterium]HOS33285.1 L-threonylcarbamoyladenylate synthase [Spirochaetota bacterium]HOS55210.1 L-threonylcarbamoyladenylate synthase [Spirochaetota bacterium]HPK61442.1 L-threonylcarbamoyladenylate synthase [Spirochaetota bacterium]HQF78563.1 L-threonylcarbamoyladenylate synthase [Spirochaetota bacterium]
MSKILYFDANYDKNYDVIVETLSKGEVAIAPTDTIYGFLAKPCLEERVRELKMRDNKPFLFLISKIEQLNYFDIDYKIYSDITSRYWPGNITFIMGCRSGRTVGIRMPDNIFIKTIVSKLGVPLLSTSVNSSGEETINEPDIITEKFGEAVPLIVIDKNFHPGKPSTIVDISKKPYKILRYGEKEFLC